jgi:hypothetical protein
VAVVQYTFTHKQYTEYRERSVHNNKNLNIYKNKKLNIHNNKKLNIHNNKKLNIHNNKKLNIHKNKKLTNLGSAGRAPSLRVIPWHLPYS